MRISTKEALTNTFHKEFYNSIDWRSDLKYFNIPILKNPLDLFTIQQLIVEIRPNIIIETGTAYGGSALFYAHTLENLESEGNVITIDKRKASYVEDNYPRPIHPRIHYYIADSVSEDMVKTIEAVLEYVEAERVMVILDSDHHKEHVEKELLHYSDFVTPNSYLVVEDTNTDLVLDDYGPGAKDAVAAFLDGNETFEAVKGLEERFLFSFNSYLRRIR